VSVAAGSGSNAATAAMCAWFVWRAVCSLSSARAALQLRTSLAQAASQSSSVWKIVVPCLVVSPHYAAHLKGLVQPIDPM
jgi:hypothetical protein